MKNAHIIYSIYSNSGYPCNHLPYDQMKEILADVKNRMWSGPVISFEGTTDWAVHSYCSDGAVPAGIVTATSFDGGLTHLRFDAPDKTRLELLVDMLKAPYDKDKHYVVEPTE